MIAYLDWSKAEDNRVEAAIAQEAENGLFSNRRGVREIWAAIEQDTKEQQFLFSQIYISYTIV